MTASTTMTTSRATAAPVRDSEGIPTVCSSGATIPPPSSDLWTDDQTGVTRSVRARRPASERAVASRSADGVP